MKPSVKSDFPIFDDSDLVYLDNASTTQKPQQVLDAIQSMYSKTNANVHRALYDIGSEATEKFENSRKKFQTLFTQILKVKLFLQVGPLNQ